MFEPVHGSAPKYAGMDRANPLGAILTMGMLIAHLGFESEADRVERAVRDCLDARECTVDVGGELGARATGDAVVRRLLA
jgi:3-isopropylmalate dehydrogenase